MNRPKPLGDLLAQGLPQECLVRLFGIHGPGDDRSVHLLLVGEQRGQGHGLRAQLRPTLEHLIVRHDTRDGRPVPGDLHGLERHPAPTKPAVQQVQLHIHGLHEGRMEWLTLDPGEAAGNGRPAGDGLPATPLEVRHGAGGVHRSDEGPSDRCRSRAWLRCSRGWSFSSSMDRYKPFWRATAE